MYISMKLTISSSSPSSSSSSCSSSSAAAIHFTQTNKVARCTMQSFRTYFNTCIQFIPRFATSLVFWGLSLNAGSFGDVYLNTFLSGLIEIPANVVCIVFLKYLGRRRSNAWSLMIGGLFCLSIIPVLVVNPGESFSVNLQNRGEQ